MNTAYDHGASYLSPPPQPLAQPSLSLLERLAQNDSEWFSLIGPYFAPIGRLVRIGSGDFWTSWIRLTIGHGTSSRLFAIALGYFIDALLVALYLNVLTVGNVKSAGRAVRSVVRQQLLVLKVGRTPPSEVGY